MKNIKGNSEIYSAASVPPLCKSPLAGVHIAYLGSSVTLGSASGEESFAEFIARRNACTYEKYAVSGTTLADNGENSYVSRLKKIKTDAAFDIFVCQLSTNDAAKTCPLGALAQGGELDTQTVCGAMEYIISHARAAWRCPVVFYTNCYYENAHYAAMVALLKKLAGKYPYLTVIDLYTDGEFNSLTAEERALYMADKIHPTKAGYLEWWTPEIEKHLYKIAEILQKK